MLRYLCVLILLIFTSCSFHNSEKKEIIKLKEKYKEKSPNLWVEDFLPFESKKIFIVDFKYLPDFISKKNNTFLQNIFMKVFFENNFEFNEIKNIISNPLKLAFIQENNDYLFVFEVSKINDKIFYDFIKKANMETHENNNNLKIYVSDKFNISKIDNFILFSNNEDFLKKSISCKNNKQKSILENLVFLNLAKNKKGFFNIFIFDSFEKDSHYLFLDFFSKDIKNKIFISGIISNKNLFSFQNSQLNTFLVSPSMNKDLIFAFEGNNFLKSLEFFEFSDYFYGIFENTSIDAKKNIFSWAKNNFFISITSNNSSIFPGFSIFLDTNGNKEAFVFKEKLKTSLEEAQKILNETKKEKINLKKEKEEDEETRKKKYKTVKSEKEKKEEERRKNIAKNIDEQIKSEKKNDIEIEKKIINGNEIIVAKIYLDMDDVSNSNFSLPQEILELSFGILKNNNIFFFSTVNNFADNYEDKIAFKKKENNIFDEKLMGIFNFYFNTNAISDYFNSIFKFAGFFEDVEDNNEFLNNFNDLQSILKSISFDLTRGNENIFYIEGSIEL